MKHIVENFRRKKKCHGGMTLVEVIVSIALIGIIASMTLFVLTSSMLLSIRSSQNTEKVSEASAIVAEQLTTPSSPTTTAIVYFNESATPSDTIEGWIITGESSGNLSDSRMITFMPKP